jgi:hypothetical protein
MVLAYATPGVLTLLPIYGQAPGSDTTQASRSTRAGRRPYGASGK